MREDFRVENRWRTLYEMIKYAEMMEIVQIDTYHVQFEHFNHTVHTDIGSLTLNTSIQAYRVRILVKSMPCPLFSPIRAGHQSAREKGQD